MPLKNSFQAKLAAGWASAINLGSPATCTSLDSLRTISAFDSVTMFGTVDELEVLRKSFVVHKGRYLSLSASVSLDADRGTRKLIDG
jgi:hypothetical protein